MSFLPEHANPSKPSLQVFRHIPNRSIQIAFFGHAPGSSHSFISRNIINISRHSINIIIHAQWTIHYQSAFCIIKFVEYICFKLLNWKRWCGQLTYPTLYTLSNMDTFHTNHTKIMDFLIHKFWILIDKLHFVFWL